MKDGIRIVFMGTPDFAVPSLEALLEDGYHVVGVVTQPDKPQGRKKMMTAPPVKEAALRHGLPVMQPPRLRLPQAVDELAQWQPDVIVTAAYGQILPKAVLDMPEYGCLNVHGSLLPRYRGGAPVQRAIMNGETMTGVTLMYMAEGLDTGDMIARAELPIEPDDTSGTVFAKLSLVGAQLLREQLPLLLAGKAGRTPQNEHEATYASNLTRVDEKIDWHHPSRAIYDRIRGLIPFSGAFTLWDGMVFKIWAAKRPEAAGWETVKADGSELPGTVLKLTEEGIEVRTGDGSIWLTEVQPAGKKAMAAGQFARGGQMKPGTVLT